jgi:hypothetical protein
MNKIHETFCSEAIYLLNSLFPSKQIIPLGQISIDIKYIQKIQILLLKKCQNKLTKFTVHGLPFQPANKNQPTTFLSPPPGLAAHKPTGGPPRQPAHAARLGRKLAQQPLEAAAVHSRPI